MVVEPRKIKDEKRIAVYEYYCRLYIYYSERLDKKVWEMIATASALPVIKTVFGVSVDVFLIGYLAIGVWYVLSAYDIAKRLEECDKVISDFHEVFSEGNDPLIAMEKKEFILRISLGLIWWLILLAYILVR